MLHVISEENKMERTAVCDIIYDWKKNEEQEKKVMMTMMMMMMISISYHIFIFIP